MSCGSAALSSLFMVPQSSEVAASTTGALVYNSGTDELT
jgi:hypothetical protein